MTGITILVVVLVAATAFGLVWKRRAGKVRTPRGADTADDLRALLTDSGARTGVHTVLHFSAEWCGPCAAVRRVVGQVVDDLDDAVELEIDIDAHPQLARAMSVMSLPTTFVLDENLTETARISGVPKSDALRSALVAQ